MGKTYLNKNTYPKYQILTTSLGTFQKEEK